MNAGTEVHNALSGPGNSIPGEDPGPVPDYDHPFITLYCGHCGFPLKVELSCGSRVCPHCRKKWYGYHYGKLCDIVGKWEGIRHLILTIKNIPDNEFSRHHVKQIRDWFTELRRRFKMDFYGGFYVVQATNVGRGWHLHLHILYDGNYIRQKRLSAAWKDITGSSYIVHIATVKQPAKAVSYLLADFSGDPRIRPEDAAIYDGVFKGSRLVQPFGAYRKYRFKVPFKCPVCGACYWTFLEDLLGDKRRFHRCYGDDP